MIGIQIDFDIELLLKDADKKLSESQKNELCKIRQGEKTCRYIMLGPQGYVCMKNTKIKKSIDNLCNDGQMIAIGDNCGGLGECYNAISKKVKE